MALMVVARGKPPQNGQTLVPQAQGILSVQVGISLPMALYPGTLKGQNLHLGGLEGNQGLKSVRGAYYYSASNLVLASRMGLPDWVLPEWAHNWLPTGICQAREGLAV